MKLTLLGENVRIYRKEKTWSGGTFSTYSMSVASKDKEGNWINGYLDCLFKKDAPQINNKAIINIKNGFPVLNEYNGKTYIKWLINEFEIVDEGEKPAEVNLDEGGFMEIPTDGLDEIPFA